MVNWYTLRGPSTYGLGPLDKLISDAHSGEINKLLVRMAWKPKFITIGLTIR